MSIFQQTDYKRILKTRIKEVRARKPDLTLKKISNRIQIQYTYLSRVLGREKGHLNEEHLFSLCQLLDFYPDETDYLFLLRSFELAHQPQHREFVWKRIQRIRSSYEVHATANKPAMLGAEINFLLSPLAWLTYFFLGLEPYRKAPRLIANELGIPHTQLQAALQNLFDMSMIEIDGDLWHIKKVIHPKIHYGSDHPLMRAHQQLLRPYCDRQLSTLPETDKFRFMVTFSAEEETRAKLQNLLNGFLRDAERLVSAAKNERIYQLNIDLFRWSG